MPKHRPRPVALRLAAATTSLGLVAALAFTSLPASADPLNDLRIPDRIRAGSEAGGTDVVAPALRAGAAKAGSATVEVSVALSTEAIGDTLATDAVRTGELPSKSAQQAQQKKVRAQQDSVVKAAGKVGGTLLGRATRAANVVALSVPADRIDDVAKISGVLSIKPVARYETTEGANASAAESGSLGQAADYLKVSAARKAGYDGRGVKVAVLDSGIDYTHANLGGPGTTAAYTACHDAATTAPTGACAALFGPNAPKVKGGYDFVGETWPNTPNTTPDPNPIDTEGHGTHVSDIIAGRSADKSHLGIAPGADLYALKVCSAVASSCNGVAILQAIDWSLDPNGDGDVSDAVDVVNLSLGSSYGQPEDDSAYALDNLVRAGVVAVASAGNSADRPFIVGSPSSAPRVISVAQTALPDDKLYTLSVDSPTIPSLSGNEVRNAKLQSWGGAFTSTISGSLAQPGGTHEGCTTADFNGFPSGAVALVKRGTCNASVKAQNAQAAGAAGVVIWNNVAGDPPDFSFGGGAPVTVPTWTISFDDGGVLSDAVSAGPVKVTLDPAEATSLTDTVVGTSSRGVAIDSQRAKPDIGAPGAWLSAEVGTGAEETNFGGTSGAAPVITGSAALVIQKYPRISPAQVKARLLNAASTGSRTPDAAGDLYATPISRVGAGEVRVAPALANTGTLRVKDAAGGALGLGLPRLTRTTTLTKEVTVTNTGSKRSVYLLKATFRDRADQRSGAVQVSVPQAVSVPAKSSRTVQVRFRIDPKKLADWEFTHSAGRTGEGSALNGPEFDGFLTATSTTEKLHVGWTVLPRKSADVSTSVKKSKSGAALTLRNASGATDGVANVFGLTGTSPRIAKTPAGPGSPGSNSAVVDLAAAGVRDDTNLDVLQFALASHQRRLVPLYPAGYEVDIDTDRDGTVDYAVFQQEAVGFGSSGLSLVYVLDVATNQSSAYYYNDADFDSATSVFTLPLSAIGLSKGDTFDFSVLAYDNYFTGDVTDAIEDQTWTVGSSAYSLTGNADQLVVGANRSSTVTISKAKKPAPTTQSGLLLLHENAVSRDFTVADLGAPTP